jgi:hypothetical protein
VVLSYAAKPLTSTGVLMSSSITQYIYAFDAFIKELNNHDWTYQYSDDSSVYRAGSASAKRLEALAATDPYYQRVYDLYLNRGYSVQRINMGDAIDHIISDAIDAQLKVAEV